MIIILFTILFFVLMEAVAWLTHKFVMHGFLWTLHHDHHKKDTYGFLEKNDYFFLIFALPGITLLLIGTFSNYTWCLGAGLGITLYGLCYFIVHDVFIHQRLPFLRNSNNWYLRAIRRAHKMHHKHLGKHHGECFGMLWVPLKYYKDEIK